MVSRSDPGSFQRTTTCIWMPDVRLLHYFEPTQWGSVSGLDDGKRKTKRGWSPGDSLNLVRVLSVRVNYSQQCRNDINGRWEYSKSINAFFKNSGTRLGQRAKTGLFDPVIFTVSLSSIHCNHVEWPFSTKLTNVALILYTLYLRHFLINMSSCLKLRTRMAPGLRGPFQSCVTFSQAYL